MAQAFGIGAGAKYEEHGGPSLRAIACLLRDWSRDPDTLDRLLDVMVINMVVGNADAHAKNLSVLHFENGAVSLAPAYDIVSTALYPNVDVRPGMFVNGKISIHDVTTEDVLAEAASWGLQKSRAGRRLQSILERSPEASAGAAGEVPMAPKALIELVRSRSDRFTASFPH